MCLAATPDGERSKALLGLMALFEDIKKVAERATGWARPSARDRRPSRIVRNDAVVREPESIARFASVRGNARLWRRAHIALPAEPIIDLISIALTSRP